MIKRLAVVLLALTLTGCAVQHTQAPQIDAKTTYALNLASQVDQANRDYKTFFADVGTAERAGQLSQAQVGLLNIAGTQLKGIIEKANTLEKTYAANYDASIPQQITALLTQAAQIYTSIYTQRAQMLAQRTP